jgi:ABC-type uncharacterized transport system YnjBCD ATPase subunit
MAVTSLIRWNPHKDIPACIGVNFLSLSVKKAAMKRINLEVNDQLARVFEQLSDKQKANAALLAALIAQATPRTLADIFEQVDKKVALSGLTNEEIELLLDEIS